MKRIIAIPFIILIICSGINIYGQDSKFESFLKTFNNAKHDTTRIKAYLKMGDDYRNENLDSALNYYQKALALSNKNYDTISTSKSQTLRIFALSKSTALRCIGIVYYFKGSNDNAVDYYTKALRISEKIDDKKGITSCCNNIGLVHASQGSYEKALEYYLISIKTSEEVGDKKGMSNCYNLISNVYYYQGNYERAIDYYFKSLKNREEIGDKYGMAECYGNIGNVYKNQSNFERAIEYSLKALRISEELNNKRLMSFNYNTLGTVYTSQRKFDLALEYYFKSLKIEEEFDAKQRMSQCYTNIGSTYNDLGDYDKAIQYHLKSLKISEEIGDKNVMPTVFWNIALLHVKLADSYAKNSSERIDHLNIALENGLKAITLAQEIKATPLENVVANTLMEVYKKLGNYPKAMEFAEVYMITKDSLYNEAKNKEINGLQLNYERDKNLKEKTILEKDKTLAQEKAKRQTLFTIFFGLGFIMLLALAFFIYRGKKKEHEAKILLEEKNYEILEKNEELNQMNEEIATQRDNLELMNTEITLQHDQIFRQHQDITASINYASRIQHAMLPSLEVVTKNLPDFFVLYRPCQIVSGDFYWFKQLKNIVYIVAADCTGHGIPGAFMSMLGLSLLNDVISPRDVNPPHEYLNELRKRLKNTLHQTGHKGEQQDGMDIALCMIDIETNIVQFSGAYNPLYLLRNNELIVYKGDRMPIGVYPKDKESFTTKEIQLQPDDCLYIFSDGYVSQTGGDDFKKFKSTKLQETLLQIQNKSMCEQKQILETTLDVWKGDNEQVDDILLIGVRINDLRA